MCKEDKTCSRQHLKILQKSFRAQIKSTSFHKDFLTRVAKRKKLHPLS